MPEAAFNQCPEQALRLEVLYECLGPEGHEGGCFMEVAPVLPDSGAST